MISRFYLILDKVRERSLSQVSGIALFATPVPERGPKSVSRGQSPWCRALGLDSPSRVAKAYLSAVLVYVGKGKPILHAALEPFLRRLSP